MMYNSMPNRSIVSQVFLRPALATDILALEALINRSYLFDEGWTNETELVGGIRTNVVELESVIDDAQQHLFVYPQTDNGQREGQETGKILGCINVAIEGNSAYIGFFAVNPDLQGSGVGSKMLEEAETIAQNYLYHPKVIYAHHSPEQNISEQALYKPASPKSAENKSIKMLVLNGRDKMLAYYQRRGYVCTGNTQSFSENDGKGEPKDSNLYFIEIEKIIS